MKKIYIRKYIFGSLIIVSCAWLCALIVPHLHKLGAEYDKYKIRYAINQWREIWPSLAHTPEHLKMLNEDGAVLDHEVRFEGLLIGLPATMQSHEVERHLEVADSKKDLLIFKPEKTDQNKWFLSKKEWLSIVSLKQLSETEMKNLSFDELQTHLEVIKKRIAVVPKITKIQQFETKEGFGVFIQQSEKTFNGFFWPVGADICIPLYWRLMEDEPMDSSWVFHICRNIRWIN